MKYKFKNCRVLINEGTGEPARNTPAQEMAGVTIQRTYENYGASSVNYCVRPRFILIKS